MSWFNVQTLENAEKFQDVYYYSLHIEIGAGVSQNIDLYLKKSLWILTKYKLLLIMSKSPIIVNDIQQVSNC